MAVMSLPGAIERLESMRRSIDGRVMGVWFFHRVIDRLFSWLRSNKSLNALNVSHSFHVTPYQWCAPVSRYLLATMCFCFRSGPTSHGLSFHGTPYQPSAPPSRHLRAVIYSCFTSLPTRDMLLFHVNSDLQPPTCDVLLFHVKTCQHPASRCRFCGARNDDFTTIGWSIVLRWSWWWKVLQKQANNENVDSF
jgi:hypothetical protein